MRAARLAVAPIAVVLAVMAFVLARDVHSWSDTLDRADARFAVEPSSARWNADTWLPGDPARGLAGLDDDLAVRRAEQAFRVALAAPRGFDNGANRSRVRAEAEVALSDVVATGSAEQASRAGNLIGILETRADDEADAAVSDRQAADAFAAAIRASSSNTDAKYNLELVLRRARVVGVREGPGSGSGTRGDSQQGAGAGGPGSGY